jgi:hypothetical protein
MQDGRFSIRYFREKWEEELDQPHNRSTGDWRLATGYCGIMRIPWTGIAQVEMALHGAN